MTTLKELMDSGAFVPDELVKKEIKFSLVEGGEELTYEIYVRRLSIGIHEAIWSSEDKGTRSKTALLLSEAVRLGENGTEKLPYEKAFALNPRLALAMSTAVSEVNGGDRKN